MIIELKRLMQELGLEFQVKLWDNIPLIVSAFKKLKSELEELKQTENK